MVLPISSSGLAATTNSSGVLTSKLRPLTVVIGMMTSDSGTDRETSLARTARPLRAMFAAFARAGRSAARQRPRVHEVPTSTGAGQETELARAGAQGGDDELREYSASARPSSPQGLQTILRPQLCVGKSARQLELHEARRRFSSLSLAEPSRLS